MRRSVVTVLVVACGLVRAMEVSRAPVLSGRPLSGAAPASVAARPSEAFAVEVMAWLEAEGIPFEVMTPVGSGEACLVVSASARRTAVRPVASPRRLGDCEAPRSSHAMTERFAAAAESGSGLGAQFEGGSGAAAQVVHLHEDVWRAKGEIAKCRLRARAGRFASRHFARKTTARRVDAPTARAFLEAHHLWGAIKCKHNYGLFSDVDGALVAVGAFSAKRAVRRGGEPRASHELVRYCARRDGAVVGGISKVISAFCRAHEPDDVVTVVDRDWGTGAGWRQLGFQQIQVLPPLAMVVGDDGLRRYLLGAGLDSEGGGHRLGVDRDGLAELDESADAPERVLDRRGLYPVFDAGVERLLLLVSDDLKRTFGGDARAAFRASAPKYGDAYYSSNAGVAALLRSAAAPNPTRGAS